MPKQVKVVNVTDDSTYVDITEAVVENEKAENEPVEENTPEEVSAQTKAKAERVSKPEEIDKIQKLSRKHPHKL